MAVEGGYAASSQFKAISDTATQAALSVANMATHFAAISSSLYTMSSAVQAFAQLEQTLVLANSVAQGSAEQLNQMTQSVRDFALAYKFSAEQGASALYFLSSAGFTVSQSLQAMNGVMLYSQATLTDVAHSAETLSTAMSAFGLAATDANRVANLFAASIAATQASPEKLAYAMRQVAPVASAMGASIEQTVAAMSELFNVGNRGQQTGTILRDILLRLSAPTTATKELFSDLGIAIQTTTGEARNFIDVLKDIQKANLSVTSLDTIFGTRGTVGATVLLKSLSEESFQRQQQIDPGYAARVADTQKKLADQAKATGQPVRELKTDFDLMIATLNNTQAATRIANSQLVTLATSFSLAKNAVTEVGLTIGQQFAPGLKSMADGITDAVIAFRSLNSNQKSLLVDLPLLAVGFLAANRAITSMIALSTRLTAGGDLFGVRQAITNVRTLAGDLRAVTTYMQTSTGQALASFPTPGGGRGFYNPRTFAPVAATDVTTARTNAFTGAAAGAGSFLGAAVGAIGSILTVATIAIIAAQVLPVIYEYFKNRNRPDSDLGGSKDFASETRRIVSSTLLGGGTDIEKLRQLEDQAKVVQQTFEDFNATIGANERNLNKAEDALREYLAVAAENKGSREVAKDIRNGAPLEGSQTAFADPMGGTGAEVDYTGAFISTLAGDATVKKLRAQVAQAQSNIEDRKKTLETIPAALENLRKAQADLLAKDGVAAQKAFDDVKAAVAKNDQEGVFTYQSKTLVNASEKDARSAALALQKLQAELNTDPLEVERANIALIRDGQLKRWEDWSVAESKKVEEQFGAMFAGGNLGKALTGQTYFATQLVTVMNNETGNAQKVFQKVKDAQGKDVVVTGALDLFKQGAGDEAIVKAFQDALAERTAALNAGGNIPANVREYIDRLASASATQIKSWLGEVVVKEQEELVKRQDTQRRNAAFVQTLRDSLFGQQSNLLSQIFSAGGNADFSLKTQFDTIAVNRQFEDQLRQIEDYEKKYLLELEGRFKSDPSLKAQWDKFKNDYIALITAVRNDAIKNLATANQNAQQAAINAIQSATEAARIGETQIATELDAFYRATGQGVPRGIATSARQTEALQQVNAIDQQIRSVTEAIAKVQAQAAAARSALGVKKPEFNISPPESSIGAEGASRFGQLGYHDAVDKLKQANEDLAHYKELQDQGFDEFRQIEEVQKRVVDLKARLAESSNSKMPAPPKLENPVTDPGASSEVIAGYNAQADALKKQLALLQQQKEALVSVGKAANDNANQAIADYRVEQAELDKFKGLYERNGNVLQGLQYGIAKAAHASQTDFQIAAQAFETFANSAASNLTDLITGQQKDWHVALANIAKDIANTILKALILKSISAIFGGGGAIGPPTNLLPSANGNVFSAGNVVPFANGGVVSRPTFFPMANGGVGLMGEAGEEAVIPLKRGRDGKLGVAMSPVPGTSGGHGGSGLVFSPQFNFNMSGGEAAQPQSTSSRQQRDRMIAMQRDMQRETEVAVGKVLRKWQRPGEPLMKVS
jgi:TP901 family phage tail tape measure protein/lambda family phage tail tape measure protein